MFVFGFQSNIFFAFSMSFFYIEERFTPKQMELEIQMNSSGARINNMLSACHKKCVKTDKQGITNAENLCVDRCVSKFFKVVEMMEEKSKERMENEQKMMDVNQ